MKKIITIIALVLVAAMLMATPIGATDIEHDYGQDVFTGNKLTNAPVIDGNVSAEEYGQITSAKTEPNA